MLSFLFSFITIVKVYIRENCLQFETTTSETLSLIHTLKEESLNINTIEVILAAYL